MKRIVANKTQYTKDNHKFNTLNKILKEIEYLKDAGKKKKKKLKINYLTQYLLIYLTFAFLN